MWEQFIDNCRKHYAVGAFVNVDEQLTPFRGRCSFRQYIPSKPDNYRMKLFLLCDCLTGYTFNRMPHIGGQENRRNVGLSADVKFLFQSLHFTGFNIKTSNWFTSFQLATDLLQKQITLLGRMRKNRPELSIEFVTGKRRRVGSSYFGFSDKQTLVSYVLRKNKAVVLLSTMHNDKIDEDTGLPDMILDYNATKAITVCRRGQSAGHLRTSTIASI